MLDTLTNVKLYIGVSGSGDNELLEMIMDDAQTTIENYVGYGIEESTITNEYHSTDGNKNVFIVDYPPISSGDTVTIKYDGEVVSADNYNVIYNSGVIAFNYCPTQSVKKLSFDYTGGYATIPADLKMVFRKICNDMYKSRRQQGNVTNERLGDYSISFSETSSGTDLLTPYKAVLDNYRHYAF